jgi:hypothetical protein
LGKFGRVFNFRKKDIFDIFCLTEQSLRIRREADASPSTSPALVAGT